MKTCESCGKSSKRLTRAMCHTCYMRWYLTSSEERRRKNYQHVNRWRKNNPEARKIEYKRAVSRPGFKEKETLRKKISSKKKQFGGNWEAVLDRDGHQCVMCHKPTTTIHHKDGRGNSSNSPNNHIDNLITCCQSCHMKYYHPDLIKKNLIDKIPWNKGLTHSDERVYNNLSGIREYWAKHK